MTLPPMRIPQRNHGAPPASVPIDALCLRCNYALRGLSENRCPECGTPFDPSDPWTMNLGRPLTPWARRAITPVGAPTRRLMNVALASIIWGLLWLPGAYFVAFFGMLLLLLLYVYRIARAAVRVFVRRRYRQPRAGSELRMRPNPYLAAGVCALSILNVWPLGPWITLMLARPFIEPRLHRTYAVDPAPARDEQMIFVGPFLVERFTVRPSGVRLGVFGGLGIIYTEDVDAETSGYRPHWHIATWDDRYAW